MNMNNENQIPSIVMLPQEVITSMQENQQRILKALENFKLLDAPEYLTALEFMDKLKICRATFDQLRSENKIKVVKKGRKLYIPSTEVQQYFERQ